MAKEVQQIWVTFIYSNPKVTKSPENLLGGCSIFSTSVFDCFQLSGSTFSLSAISSLFYQSLRLALGRVLQQNEMSFMIQ